MLVLKKMFAAVMLLLLICLVSCEETDWSSDIDNLRSQVDSLYTEIGSQQDAIDSLNLLLDNNSMLLDSLSVLVDSISAIEDVEYILGEPITGYETFTAYKAEHRGFLVVKEAGAFVTNELTRIYYDHGTFPRTLIGEVSSLCVFTYPLNAGDYFRVTVGNGNKVAISYIPILKVE